MSISFAARAWAVGGLFVLLIGLQLATPGLDSDQAVTGLMGLHVLRGELPLFFWSQHHAGVPEAYLAAVSFAFLGVSRLALDLVPAVVAAGLMVALYRTGAVLFGPGAGLAAVLCATVVSPYVAVHYVLARGYYIEHLLLAQLVLLGAALWLRALPALPAPAARARILIAMGLAGGVGFYCGFQIAAALLPATLALLLASPGLPWRREAWLGAGAFLVGSAPFWAYNLTHDWATFTTGMRFQGAFDAAATTSLLTGDLLPVLLGVKAYVGTPLFLPVPVAWLPLAVAGAAWTVLALRVLFGLRRLRQSPALAGEALCVVTAAVVLGLVWYGRYVQVPRYLLPMMPALALILARTGQLLWQRSRALTVALALLYLVPVGTGLVQELKVLWPAERQAYQAERDADQALLTFLRARGLTGAYGYEYWLSPRLTFDAAETVVVAHPARNRYAGHTLALDANPRPAYVLRGDLDRYENWLGALGIRSQRAVVGPYGVYWDFTAPAPVHPLPRGGWRLEAATGQGEPAALADGRLGTRWASARGPEGSAWIAVDLDAGRPLAGVSLVADRPDRVPQRLDVAVIGADGRRHSVARVDTGGLTVLWRNGAPRTVPGRTLTVRFAPVEARRVILTDLGPGGAWAVAELFLHGPGPAPPDIAGGAEGARLEAAGQRGAALVAYREAMRRAPDDPDGYEGFARLRAELAARAGTRVELADRLADLGLAADARALYVELGVNVGRDALHVDLTHRLARLAAATGETAEAQRLEQGLAAALSGSQPVGARFGRDVTLVDRALEPSRARAGESVMLTYRWRLAGARLVRPFAFTDFRAAHHRFGDHRPLPRPIADWPGGVQELIDRRRITVPPDTPPGSYRVVVHLIDPVSGSRVRRYWLGLLPTTAFSVDLGQVEVVPGA